MSLYARPANRMIVCMEERCMMDGYSSNQLGGGGREQEGAFRRKDEDGANEEKKRQLQVISRLYTNLRLVSLVSST